MSRTVIGSMPRALNVRSHTYTCQRCGIRLSCTSSRPKPEHCRDCRGYKVFTVVRRAS